MSASPRCSVCIANYNGAALIAACIDSVLAQGWGDAVEIIVHDDASTDDSAALVRARYPQVRLIESPHNVGFCVANNRMADVARGEYLLLLNNDAALMPGALDTLLAEAGNVGRPAILSLPQYDAASGGLLDRGCLLDPFLNPVPNLDEARNDVGMVMGACLWIPKTLWDEIGGFPEWFGSIGEDLYLCCVARLWGYPVRCASAAGYRHHVGTSFGGGKISEGKLSTSVRRRALSERNKTFVMAVTFPGLWMALVLPLHLLILLIEGVLLSVLQGRLAYLRTIYLPAVTALFQHKAKIRQLRDHAMARSRITASGFFAHVDWMPYKLRMLCRHGLPRLS